MKNIRSQDGMLIKLSNICSVHFMSDLPAHRQKQMRNFTCKCVACEDEKKYRLFKDLPKPKIPNLKTFEEASNESLVVYADYLNKFAKYFPCQQLVFAEGEFQYHLEAIYKEKSMEMRYV